MKRILILLMSMSFPVMSSADSIDQLQSEIQQQNYSSAAESGLSLLSHNPEDVRVLFLTALAFQHDRQPDKAKHYYREALKRNPNLPEALNNLAMIELQQGNREQAIDLLVASLSSGPAYATACRNLSSLEPLADEESMAEAGMKKHGSYLDSFQAGVLNKLDSPESVTAKRLADKTAKPLSVAGQQDGRVAETISNQKKLVGNADDQLVQMIRNWARAWSRKDLQAYIGFYSKDFQGDQPSHADWVNYRRARILRPGAIKVEVSIIRIRSRSETRAIVDFLQTYQSANYSDKVMKRMVLARFKDRWLIEQESTLEDL